MPVNTAMARPRTLAVRIGNAPIMTERIVAPKIAKRRHACTVSVPGGGTNQMMSATARVTRRATLARVQKVVRPAPALDTGSPSLTSQCGWVEDLIDLLVGEDVLAADELDDPLPGLHRFGGELGRALVPDDRVQRRDGPDAVLDIALEDVRVRRDPLHAVLPECARGIDQQRLALEHDGGDHGLERVELELAGLGAHRNHEIVSDHPVRYHVGNLRDDGIHLTRHDGRTWLLGRQ